MAYTVKDLSELVLLLLDATASWESIATQLELSQKVIDTIAQKFDDPEDCLRESLELWLSKVDPVPTREQLARALQSPPVGREDIAQQVVLEFPKQHSKSSWVCLCSILLAQVLVLVMIMGCAVYSLPVPCKSLSLPVLKQELIGRNDEMKVIMGYFRNSEVDVVTLYGQAGFGKSEIALHVGHRMLQLGYNVHYIRVENCIDVESLEKELMEISGKSYTKCKGLVKWAQSLTIKTLLILDNVDGQYWVNDTSRRQLKELFLNPLLCNTFNLKVLITSQQNIMVTHSYRSYRLYSLSTKYCVDLMVRNVEFDTADLRVICDLVGNVPFASKILAKTLSSGTSAKHIIEMLTEKSKLKVIADKANMIDKDVLFRAIELDFHFVSPECAMSTFLLVKFIVPFTQYEASRHITADMMRDLNYTDFDIYACLFELSAKSFLEVRKNSYRKTYHFHELIVDYLKNSDFELAELFQAYWKNRLRSGIVLRQDQDDNDFVALTQILNHDESFSFEASIALMLNFYYRQHNLSSAARVLVSHCEIKGYNSSRLKAVDIRQGYTNLLEFVIYQKKVTTEWNYMEDLISLCIKDIDDLHGLAPLKYTHQLKREYSHIIPGSTWEYRHFLEFSYPDDIYTYSPVLMTL